MLSSRSSSEPIFPSAFDTPKILQTQAFLQEKPGKLPRYFIGMILDELEVQGVADNTAIIYTSDNGYICGALGYASRVLPNSTFKKSGSGYSRAIGIYKCEDK